MSILIAIRRRWDDSMSRCAVLYGSSNVHECWYRSFTLWLTYIPSNSVAARVLNTFQNVSLYFELYLTYLGRKNVNIVNDSMIRQYYIDHRSSWCKRQSWGGRASPMSILNDGCVVRDFWTSKYNKSQRRGVARPYLHHKKRWVY